MAGNARRHRRHSWHLRQRGFCNLQPLKELEESNPTLSANTHLRRHTAEHVADCGLLVAADEVIRGYAASHGAVVIIKDDDFVVHQPLEGGPAVVWIRTGNTRKAELLRRIEADCTFIVAAPGRGETLVELA